MKTARQLFVCFCCVLPTIVSAGPINGVNILSQSYSVSGSYSYQWYQSSQPFDFNQIGQPIVGDFYMSGSGTFGGSSNDGTPLNVAIATPSPSATPLNMWGFSTVNGIYSGLWVNNSIDLFSFQSIGFALPSGSGFQGTDGLYYNVGLTQAGAAKIINSAQASWLFQPTSDNLQVLLNFYQNTSGYEIADQTLSITLTDVTDMNTLFSYSGNAAYLTQHYAFSLNSSDQYQLSVSSDSRTFDSDALSQQFSAAIEPVPEPSPCILFPLAMAAFIASRKCFCSNSHCLATRAN